jgi:hypothetical protein
MALNAAYLEGIADTALFYPCSGQDLDLPVRLFASAVSDFYFVDIRQPRRPRIDDVATLASGRHVSGTDTFVHRVSGRSFRLHRWERRAEDALSELPRLGVFFFRGDNPVDGEGSSGVLWLGEQLFSRILDLLIPGGLVVTDGSNLGPGGPKPLSKFYDDRQIRDIALSKATPFEYQGRQFQCVAYVGEKYGPTLVWRAA